MRRSSEILNGCLGRLGLRLSRVDGRDALSMIRTSAGALINTCLGVFGLRLSRVHNPDAIRDPAARAIAKGISTREYNTPGSMDAFYADPHLMTHYFTNNRLAFYPSVCDHLTRLNIRPVDVLDVGCGSRPHVGRAAKGGQRSRLLHVHIGFVAQEPSAWRVT